MGSRTWFQSHYGAIATSVSVPLADSAIIGFNPTMVRLRLHNSPAKYRAFIGFQSHYGAIATSIGSGVDVGLGAFQSHYGAIATVLLIAIPATRLPGFNPTMVRLRPAYHALRIRILNGFNPTMVRLRLSILQFFIVKASVKFQSHYGAIATSGRPWHTTDADWFQSHYGAIATWISQLLHHLLHLFQSHYGAIATSPLFPLPPVP